MTQETFAVEMNRRGCAASGKTFCGVYQGWPFAAVFLRGAQGRKTAFLLQMKFAGNKPYELRKLFKVIKKDLKAQAAALGALPKLQMGAPVALPGVLNLAVTLSSDEAFGRAFDVLLVALVRAAASLGFSLPPACPVCKQPGCDSFALYGGAYVPVHDACIRQMVQTKTAKAHENEHYGNYALGILGAVLGGLVGSIPTILLAVFGEFISGWLCALIPLGAYYGYKLLRGRMNTAALVVSILVPLLLTPVVFYLTTEFMIYKEIGEFLGLSLFWEAFMLAPGEVLPGFWQMLLFVGLGIFIVFGLVSRGNQHVVQDASGSLATLRPINAAAPVASQNVS